MHAPEPVGTTAPEAELLPRAAAPTEAVVNESERLEQKSAAGEVLNDATNGVTAIEPRVLELEFPTQMKLGDSDIIRVSLVPTRDGYLLTTDFPENVTITQVVKIPRPTGYTVQALAALNASAFEISAPQQQSALPEGQRVDFRWTISPKQAGQQRLSLDVKLVWTPVDPASKPPAETSLLSKPLTIQVDAVLGMNAMQASSAGLMGLLAGAGLSMAALFATPRGRKVRESLGLAEPNSKLVLEPQAAMRIDTGESQLFQTLFRKYARVVLEREFRSGYSGARTFLALPVREDGRADAYTIAKIGDKASIKREFENYEQFVKDTLPPITARIQETPVAVSKTNSDRAILRYTFIGEPGKLPVSLREALLANPDAAPIHRLFDTFGPNWWMQRKPYTFRVSAEYDSVLPAHLVVERMQGARMADGVLDGQTAPDNVTYGFGDIVQLKNFAQVEPRADGSGYSLTGAAGPGQPALRVRFMTHLTGTAPQEPLIGRVVGTRAMLLQNLVSGLQTYGLPDPLAKLPQVLSESAHGTQSTIHGDLNLENVLIGLGGIVWLIDFANTRDGHPLADFAHLEADVIAHVIAPQIAKPLDYLNLATSAPQLETLRAAIRSVAQRCLFNPSQTREYDLALYMACVGALKYNNLNAHQKQLLYLTAAQIAERL